MDPTDTARRLLAGQGGTLAAQAGIVLDDQPAPLWQLLVLCQLLSARIPATTALASAQELFCAGWTTPQALRGSTWHQRVAALGRGGYRRYDFSTATRLEQNASLLLGRWGGDLRRLREEAGGDPREVSRLLREFDGIGPTGAGIFLREVQQVWPQVYPQVDQVVVRGAERSGLPTDPAELAALVPQQEFAALCGALVRVARSRGRAVAGAQRRRRSDRAASTPPTAPPR